MLRCVCQEKGQESKILYGAEENVCPHIMGSVCFQIKSPLPPNFGYATLLAENSFVILPHSGEGEIILQSAVSVKNRCREKRRIIRNKLKANWQLYIMFFVPLLFVVVFCYIPMYGVVIAFKNFVPTKGIMGSDWVGLKYFKQFLGSYQFIRLIKNTLGISFYQLIAGFPIPIILAIAINECRHTFFRKTVQFVSYMPHFISVVVMTSVVLMLIAPRTGFLNHLIVALGGETVDFIAKPEYFKSIYVWSGIWQSMGYSSIIYFAALSGIDPALHEAAIMDGASKLKRILHIDLPGIAPTIIILLILQSGKIMNVGYEKVLLMQNSVNMSASDIIATYVYRVGLIDAQYSLSAAVGLFNNVINLILLLTVNWISKKVGDTSLF